MVRTRAFASHASSESAVPDPGEAAWSGSLLRLVRLEYSYWHARLDGFIGIFTVMLGGVHSNPPSHFTLQSLFTQICSRARQTSLPRSAPCHLRVESSCPLSFLALLVPTHLGPVQARDA